MHSLPLLQPVTITVATPPPPAGKIATRRLGEAEPRAGEQQASRLPVSHQIVAVVALAPNAEVTGPSATRAGLNALAASASPGELTANFAEG